VPKLDKHEEELMGLLFALGDSLAEAAPSEILEEAERFGVDLLNEADEVRELLRSAGRRYLQRKLQASRRAYEAAVTELQSEQFDLPTTPDERKQLLMGVLREQPSLEPIVITAQHRNFNDLTDEDVTSFLRQLKTLGLLPVSPTGK